MVNLAVQEEGVAGIDDAAGTALSPLNQPQEASQAIHMQPVVCPDGTVTYLGAAAHVFRNK